VDLDIKNWNRVHNGDTVEGHLAISLKVPRPESRSRRLNECMIKRGTWKTCWRGSRTREASTWQGPSLLAGLP